MPISVRYDPDIELLGQTAYGIGEGQAFVRERERRDQLLREFLARQDRFGEQQDMYADRERDRIYSGMDRAASRQQQGRQFDTEQQRLRGQAAQSGELALLGLDQSQQRIDTERGYRQDQQQYYLDQIAQRLEAEQQEQERQRQELAVKYNAEWKLTEEQQKALKERQQAEWKIQTQDLSQPQRAAAMQELERQYPESMFEPQLIPRPEPPINERLQSATWVDPEHPEWGLLGFDTNGRPIQVAAPPKAEAAQKPEFSWLDAWVAASKAVPDTDPLTMEAVDPAIREQQIMAMAAKIMQGPPQIPQLGQPGMEQGETPDVPRETSEVAVQEIMQQFNVPEELAAQILVLTEQAMQAYQAGDAQTFQALQQQIAALVKGGG